MGRDVYDLVAQKVRVVENAPICRQHDIYGWYKSSKNTLTICTAKIKSTAGPNLREYVSETLFHEAVHVAQSCKANDGYIEAFGISKSHMPISERRLGDVQTSVSINGEKVRNIEHEAFWMEDKPEKVKYVLEKYCF